MTRYGATEADWFHFDAILGLGQDILPVVSDPDAVISPASTMKGLGKVPSKFNRQRQAVGIPAWTSHVTTPAEIEDWSKDPGLGLCLITRNARALDIDITDAAQALEIRKCVTNHLGDLPMRSRADSSKVLFIFTMPGDVPKRVIKATHGLVELLGSGQQAVMAGTHPGRARYEWPAGLPSELRVVTLQELDTLWAELERRFALEPSTTAKTSSKAEVLKSAVSNDPVAIVLHEKGLVTGTGSEGKIFLTCPWNEEHERESDTSATTYFPANTGGFSRGHFLCLHGPCSGRTDADFLATIGIVEDHRDDFSAIEPGLMSTPIATGVRFAFVPAMEFKAGVPPAWHVKSVIPHAEMGVVFGESGAGKSFYVFDIVAAVARGIPWRGHKTKPGRVAYVVAEGASGFRNRINAYCAAHGIDDLDVHILAAAPNFMEGKDIIDLVNAIRALGPVAIVVVDTLARVSAGANENSGEDMGQVLSHCATIHKVTGATVLLVHHSGKDASKGARGWSGIKGALDFELEITRDEANRTAKVSKIKDGEGEGEQFGFTLKTISVGMDADGDDISSCVVEHGEAVTPREKVKRLGKIMDLAWSVALDMQALDGTGCDENAQLDAAAATLPQPAGRDQRRTNLKRANDNLVTMGRLRRVAPNRLVVSTQGE